jgi:SAM-dependent methyltransferase
MPPSSPDQAPGIWSAIATAYEQTFEHLSSQFAADALALLALRPGERVIDIAAGAGAFSLAAARTGARVLATDFAPGMVARLRERAAADRLSNIEAEVMDGQALSVPDASFDVGVSVLGLIFFPDISKGLSELRRVLRPGGRAAVVCWGDVRRLELVTLALSAVRDAAPGFALPAGPPPWARMAGGDIVRGRLEAAGFSDVEVTTVVRSLAIGSPTIFWETFASAAPPLAAWRDTLGPDRMAAVGRAYVARLEAMAAGGEAAISAEACIGIGRKA